MQKFILKKRRKIPPLFYDILNSFRKFKPDERKIRIKFFKIF